MTSTRLSIAREVGVGAAGWTLLTVRWPSPSNPPPFCQLGRLRQSLQRPQSTNRLSYLAATDEDGDDDGKFCH